MRTVELVPGLRCSVLGFGCAPVLGAVSARVADRAIGVALDHGVNYFDVAPSYGYGAAEAWLGGRLKGRRDDVVIATKFGIVATPAARMLAPLKPAVRALRGALKRRVEDASSDKVGAGLSGRFHRRVPIEAGALRASVTRSLKALRTDRLDLLFIHEPHEPVRPIEPVVEAMERMKAQGLIRAWGIAFMRSQTSLHSEYLERCDVRQFDLSPGASDYLEVANGRGGRANVIFSPFSGLPKNRRSPEVLRDIGLRFPGSVVLCSMFNPEHIRSNVLSCA